MMGDQGFPPGTAEPPRRLRRKKPARRLTTVVTRLLWDLRGPLAFYFTVTILLSLAGFPRADDVKKQKHDCKRDCDG